MTHLDKIRAYYQGVKALQLATDSDIIHPAKQLHACLGLVDAMVKDMESHLHLHGELPTEDYAVMRTVITLGAV